MASLFNVQASSFGCGEGAREILANYKFSLGNTAYFLDKAKHGILDSIIINQIDFVRNVRVWYPSPYAYFVLYNNIYYEDSLCDEATAISLALAYWEAKKELILSKMC